MNESKNRRNEIKNERIEWMNEWIIMKWMNEWLISQHDIYSSEASLAKIIVRRLEENMNKWKNKWIEWMNWVNKWMYKWKEWKEWYTQQRGPLSKDYSDYTWRKHEWIKEWIKNERIDTKITSDWIKRLKDSPILDKLIWHNAIIQTSCITL